MGQVPVIDGCKGEVDKFKSDISLKITLTQGISILHAVSYFVSSNNMINKTVLFQSLPLILHRFSVIKKFLIFR